MHTQEMDVTLDWERHPMLPADVMQWTGLGSCVVDDRVLVIGKRGTIGYNCNIMVFDMPDWYELETTGQGPSWDCVNCVIAAVDSRQVAVTWSIPSGFYLSILTLETLEWGTIRVNHNGEHLKGYSLSYCGHPSLLILFGGTAPEDTDHEPRLLSIDGTTGYTSPCAQRGTSRPCLRAFHAASPAPKNTLIIHGGKDLSNHTLSDLWVYDSNTFYWREIQCGIPRCRHSLGVSSDYVFIFGGLNQFNQISGSLHLWCVASHSWVPPSPPTDYHPDPLFDATVGQLSGGPGLFLVFGGKSLYGSEHRPYFLTIPENSCQKVLIQELHNACTHRHHKLDALQFKEENNLSQLQAERTDLDSELLAVEEGRRCAQQVSDSIDAKAFNQRVLLREANKEIERNRHDKIKSWKLNQLQRYERMTQQLSAAPLPKAKSRSGISVGVMSPVNPEGKPNNTNDKHPNQVSNGLTNDDKTDIEKARQRALVNAMKMFEPEP
eukprot:TRINITY_DN37693_c0_g1_i1.p1 TRINITY_DN37693_c0_g1~~TRINITY_DN37693_c0_g1_i1.p1  ORF type:complete len:530 (+),score=92.34 TRINITY_DN37693_c0_g1_i1:117-1592(+)